MRHNIHSILVKLGQLLAEVFGQILGLVVTVPKEFKNSINYFASAQRRSF